MERISKADCRQEKTGSCYTCPVYNIAYNQLKKANLLPAKTHSKWNLEELRESYPVWGRKIAEITTEINKTLCPEGKIMATPTAVSMP